MVWAQVKPGIWEDPLDGAEKIFYGMSQAFRPVGKEHGSVYAATIIKAPHLSERGISFEKALRDCWTSLRFEYPTLTLIVEDGKKIYKTPDAAALQAWNEESFIADYEDRNFEAKLHLRDLPCLVVRPPQSQVVLTASHWRIDGLGACMVLDRLFQLVSQYPNMPRRDWSLEWKNLAPSMEDAYGASHESTAEMEDLAFAVQKRNFEDASPTAALSFLGDKATPPASPSELSITFSESSTRSLTAACKARTISVTAAVHAALAEAIFRLSTQDSHDYTGIVAVNIRSHLPPPYNTSAYACAPYLTGISPKVSRNGDFASRSTALTKEYQEWYSDLYMQALRPVYKYHGEGLRARAMRTDLPPPSNITLSSLGIVEKYLTGRYDNGLEVEAFRLGSSIITRQMTLYPWTFQNKLTLSLNYNKAYHLPETVAELLQSIRQILEEGLSTKLPLVG